MRRDRIWQDSTTVKKFLTGIRGGIPFASEQIGIALRIMDCTFNTFGLQSMDGDTPSTFYQIADLGCGDGVISEAILTHYPDSRVVAIDFSEPMLHQAQQRLAPFADRVDILHADLGHSNWQSTLNHFDAVISGYCIHHLTDTRKRSLYREIYHQLKLGGCFLNIEHVSSRSTWIEETFNDALIESLYRWHRKQGGDKSREAIAEQFMNRDDQNANILASVEDQCHWLREIGFQHVDCYFKFFELAVFGGVRL
ncbi:MAG: class I SAM-dependent methyltransferase [Elainellaceae cyanobacterium]